MCRRRSLDTTAERDTPVHLGGSVRQRQGYRVHAERDLGRSCHTLGPATMQPGYSIRLMAEARMPLACERTPGPHRSSWPNRIAYTPVSIMAERLVGYARCGTDEQDLTAALLGPVHAL